MVGFKYCPQCKSELDNSGRYPKCNSCNVTFYRNSKPCAGILPVKDGKVLLSKRAIEPLKGEIDIIRGFLEEGENPKDGAIREAKEETGCEVEIVDLLGVYVDRYGQGGDYTLNIHYLGKIKAGDMKPMEDVESLHWVDISSLPTKEGFNNTKEALRDLKNLFIKNSEIF